MLRPTWLAALAALALTAPAALALTAPAAHAQQDTTQQRGVRIGLTYQPGVKPGVVVLPIRAPGGDSVEAILERDLDYGDQVAVLGGAGTNIGAAAQQVGSQINYGQWKTLGAAAIVQATLGAAGLHVVLHDVAMQRVAQTGDFPLPSSSGGADWRMAVHGIADEIQRWITGQRGIAQTRILYVRDRRVYVIDSDGANDHALTDGSAMVLGPVWSPNGRTIAYTMFTGRGWDVAVRDLASGARPRLIGASGLNFSPTFSPDGRSIVYSHGDENGTDLVMTDLQGGDPRQLTFGRGTDNNLPTFSPDGARIAFTSSRPGHPELYVMDADGSNVDLLTSYNFGDQNYRSDPAWSPDGRLIAFQSQIGGIFQVMTISLRDRAVKQLTSEGANEGPSWAPDARHLVFASTRTGSRQLFVLDTESGRARQLTRNGGRLPAWSGILATP